MADVRFSAFTPEVAVDTARNRSFAEQEEAFNTKGISQFHHLREGFDDWKLIGVCNVRLYAAEEARTEIEGLREFLLSNKIINLLLPRRRYFFAFKSWKFHLDQCVRKVTERVRAGVHCRQQRYFGHFSRLKIN